MELTEPIFWNISKQKKNSIKGDGLTKAIFSLFFLSFKYFKGIKAVLIEKTNMGRDV